jgi:hypothetical protein
MAEEIDNQFILTTIPSPPDDEISDKDELITEEFPQGDSAFVAKDLNGAPVEIYSYFLTDDPILKGLTTSGDSFILDTNTNTWYVFNKDSEEYQEFPQNPYELPTANPEILLSSFINQIVSLLSSTAIEYGYDSIDNAISYYNSQDEQKRTEARSFSTWRDSVLFLANLNIDNFNQFGTPLPTLEEFISQPEYEEFSPQPLLQTFSGNEAAGYQILDTEQKTFFGWSNIQHNNDLNGVGIGQLINSGNIKNIYSISCSIDQHGLTTAWGTDDYTVKIKFDGTPNDYGIVTDFEYKIGSASELFSGFSGLMVRINYMGKFA